MWKYTYSDELCHYGVLGMKWGMHRAAKKGQTYTYKSYGQKKWEKELNKAKAKGDSEKIAKANDKYTTYNERDKRRQSYAEKTSVGKQVVKGLLFGPVFTGGYSRMRGAGYGRLSSAAINGLLPPLFSVPISKLAENNPEYGRRSSAAIKGRLSSMLSVPISKLVENNAAKITKQ